MAEMDPFESMRSLAEMWGKSGNAFLQSQQGLFRDMAEKMRTAAEGGAAAESAAADTAGFEAARQALPYFAARLAPAKPGDDEPLVVNVMQFSERARG